MNIKSNYYQTLGVEQNANQEMLKKAFHRLSKTLHPDTTKLPVTEAADKLQEVYEAYEVLSDPHKRGSYDKSLTVISCESIDNPLNSNEFEDNLFSKSNIGYRRSFSGGELFSLLLLCITLVISLLLGSIYAFFNGKELVVKPSWMLDSPLAIQVITQVD